MRAGPDSMGRCPERRVRRGIQVRVAAGVARAMSTDREEKDAGVAAELAVPEGEQAWPC